MSCSPLPARKWRGLPTCSAASGRWGAPASRCRSSSTATAARSKCAYPPPTAPGFSRGRVCTEHMDQTESPAAWLRLGVALSLSTLGGIGMWSFPVALPAVQADFGIVRADASLPFTLAMLGFAVGGLAMGWLLDRFGIVAPIVCGVAVLTVGYLVSGYAPNLWWFAVGHAFIGVGSSATLGPLMADISHWFSRRRGIAVAICSAGNYLAGTIWPPVVQHFIATDGWRATHIGIGVLCAA